MVEAERYPHDFNGILAGAPEIYASELNGEVQAWNVLVNMDSSGGSPSVTVAGRGPAYNASYDWVGHLLHGDELWCDVNGQPELSQGYRGHGVLPASIRWRVGRISG